MVRLRTLRPQLKRDPLDGCTLRSEGSLPLPDRYLYRGVSPDQHQAGRGLTPKKPGAFSEVVMISDERPLPLDGSWTVGASEQNAIRLHECQQAGLPTAGLSTTPQLDRARVYALAGSSRTTGFVYCLDRTLFASLGVREYIVADHVASPSIPEDNEVILVASDGGALPESIIAEIIDAAV